MCYHLWERSHNLITVADRKLGYFSTLLLIVNRMIGTGIFSTPSTIIQATDSVGATLLFWVLGGIMSFWFVVSNMIPSQADLMPAGKSAKLFVTCLGGSLAHILKTYGIPRARYCYSKIWGRKALRKHSPVPVNARGLGLRSYA